MKKETIKNETKKQTKKVMAKPIKKTGAKTTTKTKKSNDVLDVVYILDRSGSMGNVVSDTIGGYNAYLDKQKDNNVRLTTVLFDDQYELLTDQTNIKDVKKLTDKTYYVRGCTALYDAVGKTITMLDEKNPSNVLFIINTDGYENASREYSKQVVKSLISAHKDWDFMYIGGDIDSYDEGMSLGIKKENIANYKKDKKGTKILYDTLCDLTEMKCESRCIQANWKKDLEDYIDENIDEDDTFLISKNDIKKIRNKK